MGRALGGKGCSYVMEGGNHLGTGNGGHPLSTAQGGGGTHNSTKRCSRALGSLSKSAALQRWKGETVLWCNTVEWWRGVGGEGNPRWFLQGATIYEPAGGAVWRGRVLEKRRRERRNWGGFGKSTVEEWGGEEGVGWRGIG